MVGVTSLSTILRAHFGVGKAEQIELLEIRWTSGHTDRWTHLAVNRRFRAVEGGEIVPID